MVGRRWVHAARSRRAVVVGALALGALAVPAWTAPAGGQAAPPDAGQGPVGYDSPGAGLARVVVRHPASVGPLDVIVTRFAPGPVRTVAHQQTTAGADLVVDVPMVPESPGHPVQVDIDARPVAYADVIRPVVADHVMVEDGEVVVVTLDPVAPQPAAPAVACAGTTPVAPPGSEQVSERRADVDGDRTDERVAVWRAGPGDDSPWYLGVEGLGAGTVVVPVPAQDPAFGAELLGAEQANPAPGAELIVRVGVGAYSQLMGMWTLDGCDLAPVTVEGQAEPLRFSFGAAVNTAVGAECSFGSQYPTFDITVAHRVGQTSTFSFDHRTRGWNTPTQLDDGTPLTWQTDDDRSLDQASTFRCGPPTHRLLELRRGTGNTPPTPAPAPVPPAGPARPVPVSPRFTG